MAVGKMTIGNMIRMIRKPHGSHGIVPAAALTTVPVERIAECVCVPGITPAANVRKSMSPKRGTAVSAVR